MAKRKDPQNDPDLRPIPDGADLSEWDVSPSTGPVRLAAMLSVRLDPDTADLVRKAARASEVTQSEFVRRAAARAAERALRPTPVVRWAPGGDTPTIFSNMPAPASTGTHRPEVLDKQRELQTA